MTSCNKYISISTISSLLILLAGCSSKPPHSILNPTQNLAGEFTGVPAHSIAANIDSLCGLDTLDQEDIVSDLASSKTTLKPNDAPAVSSVTSAGVHTAVVTGLGVASGAATAGSLGFGLIGGVGILLGSGGKHGIKVHCHAVTIIKLQDSENPISAEAFKKAIPATISGPEAERFTVDNIDIDAKKAKFIGPINGKAYIHFTRFVAPEFIQKNLPTAYSGPGRYAAYGVNITDYDSNYPYGVYRPEIYHTQNAFYIHEYGWERYLPDGKTIELITRIVSSDKTKTVVRNTAYVSLDATFDKDNYNRVKLLNDKISSEKLYFR